MVLLVLLVLMETYWSLFGWYLKCSKFCCLLFKVVTVKDSSDGQWLHHYLWRRIRATWTDSSASVLLTSERLDFQNKVKSLKTGACGINPLDVDCSVLIYELTVDIIGVDTLLMIVISLHASPLLINLIGQLNEVRYLLGFQILNILCSCQLETRC